MKLNVVELKKLPGVERAQLIAAQAHEGQKRQFGKKEAYINHPRRVAEAQISNLQKEVAWLHDVIEDADITAEDLLYYGVDPMVVTAVVAMSRKEDENYFDYMLRAAACPIARPVKAADLRDNMTDLHEGSMKDKYRLAYFVLTGHKPPERG